MSRPGWIPPAPAPGASAWRSADLPRPHIQFSLILFRPGLWCGFGLARETSPVAVGFVLKLGILAARLAAL